ADADGALLPLLPVTVHASEKARVSLNGATYFLDADTPAFVSTNGAAVLSIAQQAGSLAIPALQLGVPSMLPQGDTIALAQSTVTQSRLAVVTGDDLMNAKDAAGAALLADEFRTPG